MKTLVVVAHPDLFGSSRVNRRWVEELAKYPGEFTVHDLYAALAGDVVLEDPSGADAHLSEAAIARERALLEAHDLIVFQFPVYWYSAPALLRTWMDDIYGFGWAYGGEAALPGEPGRKLAGKRFACAVCAGDIEANYRAGGTVGFTMDQVIIPFRATANYVGAACEPQPFALFGTENDLGEETLEASASSYVTWLRELAE